MLLSYKCVEQETQMGTLILSRSRVNPEFVLILPGKPELVAKDTVFQEQVACKSGSALVLIVKIAWKKLSDSFSHLYCHIIRKERMFKVGMLRLLQINHLQGGIGKQILRASQNYSVMRAAKRINPFRTIKIQRESWLKE